MRRQHGAGKRYLIQHSAGSGKSNSIAWLAHQLIGLRKDEQDVFDSIIVVTDRRILDSRSATPSSSSPRWRPPSGMPNIPATCASSSRAARRSSFPRCRSFPSSWTRSATSTAGRRFAIIIDEAHSSQGGRTSAAMNMALSEAGGEEEDETIEDKINRIMEARKMLPNASYFAFTATPKNKTLEIFGEPYPDEGEQVKHRPSTATP